MPSTGDDLLNAFVLLASFLPVIPGFVILVRRIYHLPAFNLVLLFCLSSTLFAIVALVFAVNISQGLALRGLQFVIEFLILGFLVQSLVTKSWIRQTLMTVSLLFPAIALTLFLTKGFNSNFYFINGLGCFLLFIASCLPATELSKTTAQNHLPAYSFYVLGALFIYYGVVCVLSVGWKFIFPQNSHTLQDLKLIETIALISKSVLFTIGALLAPTHKHANYFTGVRGGRE